MTQADPCYSWGMDNAKTEARKLLANGTATIDRALAAIRTEHNAAPFQTPEDVINYLTVYAEGLKALEL